MSVKMNITDEKVVASKMNINVKNVFITEDNRLTDEDGTDVLAEIADMLKPNQTFSFKISVEIDD